MIKQIGYNITLNKIKFKKTEVLIEQPVEKHSYTWKVSRGNPDKTIKNEHSQNARGGLGDLVAVTGNVRGWINHGVVDDERHHKNDAELHNLGENLVHLRSLG
jgi:hypothetical protein